MIHIHLHKFKVLLNRSIVIPDPNDVEFESPRTSFIMTPKLGIPSSTQPVSPNAEDISLILGNVQGPRVRSYSTTISPKLVDRTNNNISNINSIVDSSNSDRKKSVPNASHASRGENK